jgi:glycosyltransferase involved in cell wall biosynthesis
LEFLVTIEEKKEVKPEISIIVCFRNEAAHIYALLQGLHCQTFQSFELLLVDDFSDDESASIATSFLKENKIQGTVIDLKEYLGEAFKHQSNKKNGIALAVSKCQANTILLTDGDCVHHPKWIETMLNDFREQQLKLGFGPVGFTKGKSLFTCFQEIDLMAMMACTKWSIRHKLPMLGNAANMLFDKATFHALNGYADNINTPSGDDIFLLQQFVSANKSVGFLENKNNIVYTHAETTLAGFIQQRIRWAGKSTSYKNNTVKLTLLTIYLLNLMVLLLAGLTFFSILPLWILATAFMVKMTIDSLIIFPSLAFFGRKSLILGMPVFECMHILYVVCIGFLSLKKSYIWKGRMIKQ